MGDIEETLKQEIHSTKNEISEQRDAALKVETYLKAKQAVYSGKISVLQTYLQSLEEQLASIETEKGIEVVDVEGPEGQSQESILEQDPAEFALQIELILENILGNLDYYSLMTSRIVSKRWNKAALNVFSKTPANGERSFGERRFLNLGKLFQSSDFEPIPELDAKLTKSIYFEGASNEGSMNISKNKFLEFCQKFSTQIEVMDLKGSAVAPIFLKTITENCPNLKTLYLGWNTLSANSQETDLIEMKSIPQEGLSKLNLNTIELYETNRDNHPEGYYDPLQRIISMSPNLERLKILANFYTNLTNNKNLKYLSFDTGLNEPFSQTKLSEMLVQVKDSLEILLILTGVEIESTNLPCMKMLKKLIIINIYPQDIDGRIIIETIASKFPNLEHLEISNTSNSLFGPLPEPLPLISKAIQGPEKHLPKIQTLHLEDYIQYPQNLCQFGILFPNLKKLELGLQIDSEVIGTEVGFIEPIFSALKGLKLKYFCFNILSDFKFLDMVKALDANQELFIGMDILEIHAFGEVDKVSYGSITKATGESGSIDQVFCEWLQNMAKNMKHVSFYDFSFWGSSAQKVMSVIKDYQLPVKFIEP